MEDYFEALISWIKENKPSKEELAKKKVVLCGELKHIKIPSDIEVYLHASAEDLSEIRPYLQTKPTRTGSGVAVIATMTKPFDCPHGRCSYCPGGLGSSFGDVPQSYTGKEPSTLRGIRNEFDAYRIVFNRLEQYVVIGQNPDKVEQIVMGGTFPSLPKKYQEEFIYYSFKAYNDFSKLFFPDNELDIEAFKSFFELPGPVGDETRMEHIKEKLLKLKEENVRSLEEEHKANENSAIRCIGLTIETRPDWGFAEHGLEMLKLGVTRVELGIQTVYDDVLKAVNRGHGIAEAKRSIAELRDLGFKMNFHMMPGMPDVDGKRISKEKDIESLRTIFSDDAFKPDMLKIYPCMVMPGTELEKKYEAGEFKPLSTDEAAEIVVEMKKFIPAYCRIMRIQRDIPTYATKAGVDRTNLRQYVDKLTAEKGVTCRCIRCREIRKEKVSGEPVVKVEEFTASNGKEFFISMEADDRLLGFVRLRLPPRSLHPAISSRSALIRELHVYGETVSIGEREDDKVQHKGFGKQLMAKAEEIAKSEGKDKMIVISGVGVRDYYRKLGYELEGPYMVKEI